jgi:hypothetical protein
MKILQPAVSAPAVVKDWFKHETNFALLQFRPYPIRPRIVRMKHFRAPTRGLCVLLVLVLTACGGPQPQSARPDDTAASPARAAAAPARPASIAPGDRLWVSVEQVRANQPPLLAHHLATLEPQRPGIVDLYFVGFASFAAEDVFLKEVRSAQSILDGRFDTRGRSLVLINNPQTVDSVPLATAANLRAALEGVARKMDVEEDVLFLYLTSHGDKRGMIAVEFGNLGLRPLRASEIRVMLDRARIRWRVIVVSACYSGSFINELRDERTLIVTAAAADKASFGCNHTNAFTYFYLLR